jgi:hypothetical protein
MQWRPGGRKTQADRAVDEIVDVLTDGVATAVR